MSIKLLLSFRSVGMTKMMEHLLMNESTPNADGLNQLEDPTVLLRLIEALRPLSEPMRIRTVQAALMFLGTNSPPFANANASIAVSKPPVHSDREAARDDLDLPRRAKVWMSQNNLDEQALSGVFHRTASGFEVITHHLPASTNKERVQQCYLLSGTKALLESGEPKFTDDHARQLCREMGCYDRDNHSSYVKSIGNLMVGSKGSGYELTQPGLRAAADIMQRLSNISV